MAEPLTRVRTQQVADKFGDYVTFSLPGTTAATTGNYNVFFTARYPMEILRITERHSGASSSGTLQIRKCPSGTAKASGSNLLSSAIATSGAADTDIICEIGDFTGEQILKEGDSLCAVEGGTLTGLQNLAVTIYYKPLGRGEYR